MFNIHSTNTHSGSLWYNSTTFTCPVRLPVTELFDLSATECTHLHVSVCCYCTAALLSLVIKMFIMLPSLLLFCCLFTISFSLCMTSDEALKGTVTNVIVVIQSVHPLAHVTVSLEGLLALYLFYLSAERSNCSECEPSSRQSTD